MLNAFKQFNENIKYVRDLEALYIYLTENQKLPNDLSDILRAQWVYSVSALDKLIHELVRIGMLQTFLGRRNPTKKYKSFSISVDTMNNIQQANTSPAEYWFEQEIVQKHKTLAFQDPDKIADALSFIWDDEHKWQKISFDLNIPEKEAKVILKTIVNRRNQIVHEADLDLMTGVRLSIDKMDTLKAVDFICKIAESIYNNIKT
jgi:hypothetical protein